MIRDGSIYSQYWSLLLFCNRQKHLWTCGGHRHHQLCGRIFLGGQLSSAGDRSPWCCDTAPELHAVWIPEAIFRQNKTASWRCWRMHLSNIYFTRLPQRTAATKQPLWKVLLPCTSSEDQWPHEWQRSPGLTAAQTGSKPLHHQKLEELCKSMGDELWWTDSAGAPDAGVLVPQPHPGVPAALQPEDGHWAHRTLPHLPAYWCAATAAELDRERLAITLATDSLTSLYIHPISLFSSVRVVLGKDFFFMSLDTIYQSCIISI